MDSYHIAGKGHLTEMDIISEDDLGVDFVPYFVKGGGASILYVWKHLPPLPPYITVFQLLHTILRLHFYYFYYITSGNRTLGLRIIG